MDGHVLYVDIIVLVFCLRYLIQQIEIIDLALPD